MQPSHPCEIHKRQLAVDKTVGNSTWVLDSTEVCQGPYYKWIPWNRSIDKEPVTRCFLLIHSSWSLQYLIPMPYRPLCKDQPCHNPVKILSSALVAVHVARGFSGQLVYRDRPMVVEIPSLKLQPIPGSPTNGWLEDDRFLMFPLGMASFLQVRTVGFRESKSFVIRWVDGMR